MSYERHGSFHRTYLAILGGAAALAVVGTVFAGLLSTESIAAPTVAPSNVTEPRITGTTRVGQVLRTTRGEWDGTAPIQYQYRWFRCDGTRSSRMRRTAPGSRTPATPRTRFGRPTRASGSARRSSRATTTARTRRRRTRRTSSPQPRPVNTTEPSITGTARVGNTLEANRGQWAGDTPITYSFVWLRCNDKGDNCSEIQGANDTSYEVRDADTGRTIRVRVTARNDRGSTSAISNPTGVVGSNQPPPPSTGGIPVARSEGSRRSPRRRVRAVLAEPGDEPDGADHRACPDHGARRASGQRCERVHACHSPRRLGPDGPDGR